MTGRSRSFDRCPRCRQRPVLCLCGDLPSLEVSTRVVVVMHRFEERHTTNTGRLAVLALPGSSIVYRGERDRPVDPRDVDPGQGEALVLFPDENARVLDAEFARTLRRPVTLVVPDGNWRQAQRTARREPALAKLPRVCVQHGAPTTYKLRQGARADGLATLEAIARALGVLEGESVQRALEGLMARVVARVLWSRGRLAEEDCAGEIPEAALAEARASGRRRGGTG